LFHAFSLSQSPKPVWAACAAAGLDGIRLPASPCLQGAWVDTLECAACS
jgi:hypothetical protein